MEKETSRIEAFSDGVFAIAITLLILEIKVPTAENDLAAQLLRQWPSYVAFVISFAFIGIMWINHHRLFTHIRRSNNALMILNLALLLGVTAVPYPTAVLAQHLNRGGQRTAAILYNATYFVIAIIFNVLWRYCAFPRRPPPREGSGQLHHWKNLVPVCLRPGVLSRLHRRGLGECTRKFIDEWGGGDLFCATALAIRTTDRQTVLMASVSWVQAATVLPIASRTNAITVTSLSVGGRHMKSCTLSRRFTHSWFAVSPSVC
jgi:uncharacterized membrane protein